MKLILSSFVLYWIFARMEQVCGLDSCLYLFNGVECCSKTISVHCESQIVMLALSVHSFVGKLEQWMKAKLVNRKTRKSFYLNPQGNRNRVRSKHK